MRSRRELMIFMVGRNGPATPARWVKTVARLEIGYQGARSKPNRSPKGRGGIAGALLHVPQAAAKLSTEALPRKGSGCQRP
jgi:hypothetical protein